MSNKYPILADYRDSRLISKSYETESVFKRTIKTEIEKSTHKKHKYLEIKDGKYIYDHSKMTSKDHFDAAEFHQNETKKHKINSVEYREHSALAERNENLAYKKEGEERKKIKEDRIRELKKKLATSMDEKDMIKYTNEINELQGVNKNNIQKSESKEKIHKVMKEFKEGKLHSRDKEGKKVTDRKQAIAIAMSEAGLSKSNEYNEEEYKKHKHHFENYTENEIKKSEAFDILIPNDFDDRIEKSKGPWKKGKHRATVYSKHKNKEVKNLDEYLDNEEIGNKLSSKKESYSWGNLVVLSNKNSWKAILHPEHIFEINKLKQGEFFKFKDEQGDEWKVINNKNSYNIEGIKNNYKGYFTKEDISF